jgi:hypothetical protein
MEKFSGSIFPLTSKSRKSKLLFRLFAAGIDNYPAVAFNFTVPL